MNIQLPNPSDLAGDIDFNLASKPGAFPLVKKVECGRLGEVTLRPIHPDDEPRMVTFHEKVSGDSIYMRYFEHVALSARTLHARLQKVCTNTSKTFAIVAERREQRTDNVEIVAVGRLCVASEPGEIEFALLVSEGFQKSTVPHEMVNQLVEIARAFGFQKLIGEFQVMDYDMSAICRRMGFAILTVPEDSTIKVSLAL